MTNASTSLQQNARVSQCPKLLHLGSIRKSLQVSCLRKAVVTEHRGVKPTNARSRVCAVRASNFECYTLQQLLHTGRGVISLEVLRNVNGRICSTFHDVCQLIGLPEADRHRNTTISEIATGRSPARLINLFVIILITCGPSNPGHL
jgi:hypothetical protein